MNLATEVRPKKFGQVVGQADSVAVIAAVVQHSWQPTALLYSGPFGCGKTTLARLTARALLCEAIQQGPTSPEPCGQCPSCLAMDKQNHPDYREVDAASHGGVAEVRSLMDDLSYRSGSRVRIVCFDECLVGRTCILMADGSRKSISKIVAEKGEQYVLSWSPEQGLESKRVTRFLRRGRKEVVKVYFRRDFEGARAVELTPDHKVYSPDVGEYVRVGTLVPGSKVLLRNPFALSEVQRQVILGGLLGDGNIHILPSGLARFRVVQGCAQREYVDWKWSILGRISKTAPSTASNGGWGGPLVRFNTRALREIADLTAGLYTGDGEDKTKRPNAGYLDHIGPLGLAVWWADDGHRGKRHLTLSTHGFPESCVKIVADWFEAKLGISWEVREDTRGKGFYLYTSGDAMVKFLALVSPYLPASMAYKGDGAERVDVMDDGGPGWSVGQISRISPAGKTLTYDLEVAGNHNFFAENWLVSNCHRLTKPGQDALLQILEEGPAGVMFLFCTTDPAKMLPTIRSRCIEMQVRLLKVADVMARLEAVIKDKGWTVEPIALKLVAGYARGHMRDALMFLEMLARLADPVTEKAARTFLRLGLRDEVLRFLTTPEDRDRVQTLEDLLCRFSFREVLDETSAVLLDAYKLAIGFDDFTEIDKAWLAKVLALIGRRFVLPISERVAFLPDEPPTIQAATSAYLQAFTLDGTQGGAVSSPHGASPVGGDDLVPDEIRRPK